MLNKLPFPEFSLVTTPDLDSYIVKEGAKERIKSYGSDSLPKIIAVMRQAFHARIPIQCKLKGTFALIICGFTHRKKLNDIDVNFVIHHWEQAEAVYLFCRNIFGSENLEENKSQNFCNFFIKSNLGPSVPLDLTFLPYNAKIPDCTSAFDGFALELIPRIEGNVDLIPTQSHWVSSYCTLEETCRLIAKSKDKVSIEHASATQKGLIRYVHKLTRGISLEDETNLPQIKAIYTQAFNAQYNNPDGLRVFGGHCKHHVFKHFDLHDPDEFEAIDSFFSELLTLVWNSFIPLKNKGAFLDKARIRNVVAATRLFFDEMKKKCPHAEEKVEEAEEKFNPSNEEVSQLIQANPLIAAEQEASFPVSEEVEKDSPLVEKLSQHNDGEPQQLVPIESLTPAKSSKEKEVLAISETKPSLPTSQLTNHLSLQQDDSLKSIHSLEEYVRKADSIKYIPLKNRVNHFMHLFKMDQNKGIPGVGSCVHSLLLELEKKSHNLSPLMTLYLSFFDVKHDFASFWIQEKLKKEVRNNSEMNKYSFKHRPKIYNDISKDMDKELAKLSPRTRSFCLIQLLTANDSLFSNAVKYLVNKNKKKLQIELITTIFSRVEEQEKTKLIDKLLKLLPNLSYEDSFFLYQKMKESHEHYPSSLIFQVFQQTTLLTFAGNLSNEFLLEGLQMVEKGPFLSSESLFQEKFNVIVNGRSNPNVKMIFRRLKNRTLSNRDLSKVYKWRIISNLIIYSGLLGTTFSYLPTHQKCSLRNGFFNFMHGAATKGTIVFFMFLSCSFGSELSGQFLKKKIKCPDFSDGLTLLNAFSILMVINPIHFMLNGAEKREEYFMPIFLNYLGAFSGLFILKLALKTQTKQLAKLPSIPLEDVQPLPPLALPAVDLLVALSNFSEIFGYCAHDIVELFGYKNSSHIALEIAKMFLWTTLFFQQAANLALFQKNRTLSHAVRVFFFPCIIPTREYGHFLPEILKRFTALNILNERTYPELLKLPDQLKKRNFRVLKYSATHLLHLVTNYYFFILLLTYMVEYKRK